MHSLSDKLLCLDRAFNTSLPICSYRAEIITAIKDNQVIVVAGDTGSGKTTHLPLMCLEAGRGQRGRIVCTQPRRIAALSLAGYVGSLLPDAPASTVASKVRFRDTIDPHTLVAFVTDGILLAETVRDPLLRKYDTIIIDEAHERTINIDFLLGYLRTILSRRPDLRVIICSATIDTRLFSHAFGNAPVVHISGRLFPVEIRHEPVIALWDGTAMRSHVDGVVHAIRRFVDLGEDGDILAFLPTVDDIMECAAVLRALCKESENTILPLFGRMHPEEQELIFQRSPKRRIVIATNIAETSITVPGIRFVIDTGLARVVRYDPAAGINRMPVERVSQASAQQRAGRCGRVREGVCIRLYSEQDFLSRPKFSPPEIKRSNLSGVILKLARLGMDRPEHFPFLQRPSDSALAAAYHHLRDLGAINRNGRLTRLGHDMAHLPVDPAIARMLLYARDHGAFTDAAVIAAALSVGDIGVPHHATRKGVGSWADPRSDFSTLVKIWSGLPTRVRGSRSNLDKICEQRGLSVQRVREWLDVHRQLLRVSRRLGQTPRGQVTDRYEVIHKSLLSAFSRSIAERQSTGLYRTSHVHDIAVSPGSVLFKKSPAWVLFHDVVETKRSYGRYAAAIEPRWIEQLFPQRCRVTFENPHYDPESGKVVALRQVAFDGLMLVKDQPTDFGLARPDQAHEVFVNQALVRETLGSECSFLIRNRELKSRIQLAQRKLRTTSLYAGDDALEELYRDRLPGVCSRDQLFAAVRARGGDGFLCAQESDLLIETLPDELAQYPDTLVVAGHRLGVSYLFSPESAEDGITVTVPLRLFYSIPVTYWEWIIPALWGPRLVALGLESDLLRHLSPENTPFMKKVEELTKRKAPENNCIPPHLWIRVTVVDEKGTFLDSFRPPLSRPVIVHPGNGLRSAQWTTWCALHENADVSWGEFPKLPDRVAIASPGQEVPVIGYPALHNEDDRVAVRVFFSEAAAVDSHRWGVRTLLEQALAEDIAWTTQEMHVPDHVVYRTRPQLDREQLEESLYGLIREMVLEPPDVLPRDIRAFEQCVESARELLRSASSRALKLVLDARDAYVAALKAVDKSVNAFSVASDLVDQIRLRVKTLWSDIRNPRISFRELQRVPLQLRSMPLHLEMIKTKPIRYREIMREIEAMKHRILALGKSSHASSGEPLHSIRETEELLIEYELTQIDSAKRSGRRAISLVDLQNNLSEIERKCG